MCIRDRQTGEIAVNSFRSTDICSANRQIFGEADFVFARTVQPSPNDIDTEGRVEDVSVHDDVESSNATQPQQQLVRSFDQGSASSKMNDTVLFYIFFHLC